MSAKTTRVPKMKNAKTSLVALLAYVNQASIVVTVQQLASNNANLATEELEPIPAKVHQIQIK